MIIKMEATIECLAIISPIIILLVISKVSLHADKIIRNSAEAMISTEITISKELSLISGLAKIFQG